MAHKRIATSNWAVPVAVGIATLIALILAKAKLGESVAIGTAIALLVYVAVVFLIGRGKI